uniref:Uncharacterized protein n=1 Tax=Anguilla anguilla TaxID=7936 RepID=A0A0E9WLZ2_ANGAN
MTNIFLVTTVLALTVKKNVN